MICVEDISIVHWGVPQQYKTPNAMMISPNAMHTRYTRCFCTDCVKSVNRLQFLSLIFQREYLMRGSAEDKRIFRNPFSFSHTNKDEAS